MLVCISVMMLSAVAMTTITSVVVVCSSKNIIFLPFNTLLKSQSF